MFQHRWLALVLLCAFMTFTPGCRSGNVSVESSKTIGQELKDLDEAYQKGIINREEYEKAKKRIVDGK